QVSSRFSVTGIRDSLPICKIEEQESAQRRSSINRPRCCEQTKGSSTWDGHPLVLICPKCGADRLIPLTFPIYQRKSGAEVIFRRPMAKCSGCGERIFAKVTA